MDRYRVLIVDDEKIARQRLRLLLDEAGAGVDVVGEAAGGEEAVRLIDTLRPDLVFLDVQMPDLTGFEVLGALESEALPAVIFVTAYDQYALRAFEVHALDYLLKPYDDERFQEALDRVRQHLRRHRTGDLTQRIRKLLQALESVRPAAAEKPSYLDRLAVKSGGRVQFFKVDEVDWIEAAGDYMCLHIGKKPHYVREKMGTLEEKLDPRRFVRIHRSTIVNRERVRELRSYFHGEYIVILHDGTQLKLSRTYRDNLDLIAGKLG